MRVSAIIQPLLLAMLATEGAEAGGVVRLIASGVRAGVTSAVTNAMRGVLRNHAILRRTNLSSGPARTMTSATNNIRGRINLSPDMQKFLKYSIITSVISGTTSGSISGTISGNAAKNGRRGYSDRAMMLSRQIMGGEEEEVAEPGSAPENVEQDVWELCFWDMVMDANVEIAGEADWIELRNLPPACAHVNTKIAELDGGNGGTSCGDDCTRYEGLSEEELQAFSDYLAENM